MGVDGGNRLSESRDILSNGVTGPGAFANETSIAGGMDLGFEGAREGRLIDLGDSEGDVSRSPRALNTVGSGPFPCSGEPPQRKKAVNLLLEGFDLLASSSWSNDPRGPPVPAMETSGRDMLGFITAAAMVLEEAEALRKCSDDWATIRRGVFKLDSLMNLA